jgi:hypothetical protein
VSQKIRPSLSGQPILSTCIFLNYFVFIKSNS